MYLPANVKNYSICIKGLQHLLNYCFRKKLFHSSFTLHKILHSSF